MTRRMISRRMTQRCLLPRSQPISLFALCLTAGLGLSMLSFSPTWAKSSPIQPVAKNFLPPVAAINDVLTPDQAIQRVITPNSDPGPVSLVLQDTTSSGKLKLTPRLKALAGTVNLQAGNADIEALAGLQQQLDEADLKSLWEATVDRNPVIRFSLEKLATPVDLQPKKSSQFLSKTLATLINGAAMGAMMMPGGSAYQNMGILSVSQAAQNIVTGNTKEPTATLTATEQIQLAGLIEDLKGELISNYHNYKKTLELLAQAHEVSIRNNNLYSKALGSKNQVAMMASASAFYKAMLNETALRHKAMLYRMHLERLAGHDAVSNLKLALFVSPINPTDQTASASPPTRRLPENRDSENPPTKSTASIQSAPPKNQSTTPLPSELAQPMELENDMIGPPVPQSPSLTTQAAGSGAESPIEPNEDVGPPLPPATLEEVL